MDCSGLLTNFGLLEAVECCSVNSGINHVAVSSQIYDHDDISTTVKS